MNFEIWSFIFGGLAGLVVGFLFKLHGLKKLHLSIAKLGVGLGVEGFEAPEVPAQSITVTGKGNKVAGRDLIEKVEQLHTDFAKIEQALTNNFNQIHNHLKAGSVSDGPKAYLVNTIYERGKAVAQGMGLVISRWRAQGWMLEFVTSDYSGMDGVTLVFSRPAGESGADSVQYFHGSRSENA